MNQRSYLDYNATAPLRPEVREAIVAALASTAIRPRCMKRAGRRARAIEAARVKVAALAGAGPKT